MASEDVKCPFCGEDGFDLPGLKTHLVKGHCEVFEEQEVFIGLMDLLYQ